MSELRTHAADVTKTRVLRAARTLFARHGIDRVTIARIADKAEVATSTVYALFKSKEGLLRAMMQGALFGERFLAARRAFEGVTDPVELIRLSAQVARAIYESEAAELGLMRGASAFSPAVRKLEREFEDLRLAMQEERVRLLFAHSKQAKGLKLDEARRVLWMYTSRDVYRMLVQEGGWTADRYEEWLAETLVTALVREPARPRGSAPSPSPRRGGRPRP